MNHDPVLQMLTFLPLEEVAALEAAMKAPGYVPNSAQRRLAEEVTRFVHGEEGLQQALKATEVRLGDTLKAESCRAHSGAEATPSATATLTTAGLAARGSDCTGCNHTGNSGRGCTHRNTEQASGEERGCETRAHCWRCVV